MKRNPGNFKYDRERASRAGKIGGSVSPGNFKNNPERARAAGKMRAKRRTQQA